MNSSFHNKNNHLKDFVSTSEGEVISTTSSAPPSQDTYSSRLAMLKINRRKTSKRNCKDNKDEDLRPQIGITEDDFLHMIDLQHPPPGAQSQSFIKKCNRCDFQASSLLSLFSHMKAHMGRLTERSGDCKIQWPNEEALDTHKKQMHTQRSPMCTICHLTFTTADQLFDHMNKHRDHLPFECPFCEHKLTNMDAYKKHVRLTHNIKSVRDLKFICRTCGIHFYTSDHLLLHRVNQNHESEPFLCKSCGASSVTANEFRSHIMEHTQEDREAANIVVCQHCYKVFFSSFRLKFHIDAKHNQSKEGNLIRIETDNESNKKKKNKGPYLRYLRANEKYECHKCKRRFKTCDTMKNHIKFSHGVKKSVKEDNTCKLCGRKFTALRRLVNHMKVHTGTKPVFQCEECGQIYGKKLQVLEHIRIDHAEQVKQQQQQLLQSSQNDCIVDLSERSVGVVIEGASSSSWTPIKSSFKVPAVEQTQEAVYSLLQLTDF